MEVLKKMKNSERGSVTVYVLSTLLVLILIAITVYVNMANKVTSQEKQVNKIQDGYSVSEDEMDEEYNNKAKVDLEIGDTVTYTPSGTYNWQGRYSGDSKDTMLNSAETNFKISQWRVLDIENGKVTLVPTAPTTGKVYLGNAQGYNNGVKLLNDACSSLYGNTAKGIAARSLNIEDIEKYMTPEALKSAHEYTSDGTKYGEQVSSAYTTNKNYPVMYAKENLSFINNGPKKENGLGMSEQTAFIEKIENGATEGKLTAKSSLRPYQTYWFKSIEFMKTGFKVADNGVRYYNLIVPKEEQTAYWLSSRCVINSYNRCDFDIRAIGDGAVSAHSTYGAHGQAIGQVKGMFPTVILDKNLITGNKTEGYFVKV